MKDLKIIGSVIVIGLLLFGCSPASVANEQVMGQYVGSVPLSGGGVGDIRTIEVDGTKCIIVGRYTALAMSCNWGK